MSFLGSKKNNVTNTIDSDEWHINLEHQNFNYENVLRTMWLGKACLILNSQEGRYYCSQLWPWSSATGSAVGIEPQSHPSNFTWLLLPHGKQSFDCFLWIGLNTQFPLPLAISPFAPCWSLEAPGLAANLPRCQIAENLDPLNQAPTKTFWNPPNVHQDCINILGSIWIFFSTVILGIQMPQQGIAFQLSLIQIENLMQLNH